jgi:NADH:ubiquinone oxidoreductase subunit 6 (subunit J)
MVIKWKVLTIAAAIVAALFAIAAPLGDSHHGIGKHNHTVADLGNVVFGAFLVGVVVLVLLIVVALIQYALRSRRTAGNSAHE